MAKVKFGDVVRECKGKIDQRNNPYEFYVAGDNMNTDDLSIRRRGCFATDDVGPAFIRTFKKGQVLYGSRRTYLRKIAVADFDGVTANTTFVLETKDEGVLRQRLLPFIMYTESFTEWSIKKSKGSTNPYVLFKDLADYEFELPDIEKQDELVELLWNMNEAKDAYGNLIASIDELIKSQFMERFGPSEKAMNIITVNSCCITITGGGTPSMKRPELYGGDIPFIKSGDVKANHVSSGALWLTETALETTTAKLVPAGAVVVVVRSAALRHEFHAAIADNPLVINQDLKAFHPKDDILPEFLLWTIQSRAADILQNVQTMLTSHIETKVVSGIKVRKPTAEEQKKWMQFVRQSDKSKYELHKALTEMLALYKRIIQDNLV